MRRYSTEPRNKIRQRMQIFVIRKKSIWKKWKKILDTATKTGLNALKTVSKKVDQ